MPGNVDLMPEKRLRNCPVKARPCTFPYTLAAISKPYTFHIRGNFDSFFFCIAVYNTYNNLTCPGANILTFFATTTGIFRSGARRQGGCSCSANGISRRAAR
jgi:hypothetical protein